MNIAYLLLITSLFSCSSSENKTFNLIANFTYDMKTLESNTIKADPTFVFSKGGLRQLILDCIKDDKIELSKDGKQGVYSSFEGVIDLSYTVSLDTVTKQFTQNIYTVRDDISSKWETLNTEQEFVIDLESNTVSSELGRYNFLDPDNDSTLQSNIKLKQVDAKTIGSTITKVLNDPKYIWISKISTSIEIGAIDFHGKKKKFLEEINDQLTSKKLKIYSEWKGDFSELNIDEYLMNRRDTVITFDPETLQENMEVFTYPPFHTNDVLKVELTQLVCFNNIDSIIETFPLDATLFHKPEDRLRSIFTIK